MKPTISAQDIQAMVSHWLNTPPNGYLGSNYGADPQSLLQNPMSAGIGDAFIEDARGRAGAGCDAGWQERVS